MVQVLRDGTRCERTDRSDAQDDRMDRRAQWTTDFLERGKATRVKVSPCWSSGTETQDDVGHVPRKGTEFPWIAKRAAKFIDQLGHNRVTLRCDNELAVEALAMEIAQLAKRRSQPVPERPPVGESQSNGILERAVELVAGQARTLKAALAHRTGARVPPDARLLCWLVEVAAYLMNRCDIGSDGKTPLQRLHGQKDSTPILEFGEKVLYVPAKPSGNRGSTPECLLAC